MKVTLVIVLLVSAFTIVCSGPFATREINQNQILLHLKPAPQKDLITIQKFIEWLSNERHERPIQKGISALFLETLHQGSPSEIAEKQDLNDLLKQVIGISTKILSKTGDYIYKIYDKEYGIDDKAKHVMQSLSDIFYIASNLSKVDSYRIDDTVRKGIKQVSEKIRYVFDYLFDRVIKEKNIDTSDCLSPNGNVNVLDGWQPIFVTLKYFQGKFSCIYLKRIENDDTKTEREKNMYKKFFEIIIKLYETDSLKSGEDKAALKESMSYFLQQVHKLNLSKSVEGAVQDLTNIFVKVLCGEQLSLKDKCLAAKASIILYVAQLQGKNGFWTLSNNRRTFIFVSSLYPIAAKLGVKKLATGIRNNEDKGLSPSLRTALTNIFPSMKDLLNNIFMFVANALKNFPNFPTKEAITQHQPIEPQKEHSFAPSHHSRHGMSEEYRSVVEKSEEEEDDAKTIRALNSYIKQVAGSKSRRIHSRDFVRGVRHQTTN